MTTKGWIFLIFILFGLLFIQNLLNIFQYKALMKQYKEISKHSYYQSVGTRKKWGRRRHALVGFSKEGVVSEIWLLNGIFVFSKFHRIKDFDGLPCEELIQKLNKKNKDHQAIAQAAGYMKLRLDNKVSDEEYFRNNPQGLGVVRREEPVVQPVKEEAVVEEVVQEPVTTTEPVEDKKEN